jgi:hypothetical protein
MSYRQHDKVQMHRLFHPWSIFVVKYFMHAVILYLKGFRYLIYENKCMFLFYV